MTTAKLGPVMNKLMTVERCLGGYKSDTKEMEGAMPPASPMATDMRDKSNCQNWPAKPQATVATLQSEQQTATIMRRLYLSASLPTGTPKAA